MLAEGAERRIVLAPDGNLFVTGADRFRFYDSDLDGIGPRLHGQPRRPPQLLGPRVADRPRRLDPEGQPVARPRDRRAGDVRARVAAIPKGRRSTRRPASLWTIDHGPQGGDEIDIIRAGNDYGWPDVSYGRQYDARRADGGKNVKVGSGKTSRKDVEEPIYYWVPSIAPSGMAFYTGNQFPEWKGNLFIGAMAGQHLVRLVLNGERVVAEEKLLLDRKQRIREVRQGPDGNLYIFLGTDLVRLTPKK